MQTPNCGYNSKRKYFRASQEKLFQNEIYQKNQQSSLKYEQWINKFLKLGDTENTALEAL